jgi:hypothetical protein
VLAGADRNEQIPDYLGGSLQLFIAFERGNLLTADDIRDFQQKCHFAVEENYLIMHRAPAWRPLYRSLLRYF